MPHIADRIPTDRDLEAVVLAGLDGLHTANPYGKTPLIADDPARPNEHPPGEHRPIPLK